MTDTLTIIRPDDWHVHLRDGDMLRAVLPFTARQFRRAIVMPNLRPPVATTARAAAYRDEILAALPPGSAFTPLMTLYLTDGSAPDDVERGFADGVVTAAKLYPAHATTNADHGVTDLRLIRPVLERMQRIGMPLLIHGEVTDPAVDIFDREAVFIDRVLIGLRHDFPDLKIVLEHITTTQAADYVAQTAAGAAGKGRLAATITAHHLMVSRNAMLAGGLRPHLYCLPILKRETHRQALVKAATSGASMFFLGTDTAPHPDTGKLSACGCAGIFTAPQAIELYAKVFETAGRLDRLEAFASRNGPAFYGLPVNTDTLTLRKNRVMAEDVKPILTPDGQTITPFAPPEPLAWRLD